VKPAREIRRETAWKQEPVKARANSARETELVAKPELVADEALPGSMAFAAVIALIGRARAFLLQRGAISPVRLVTNVGTRNDLCCPRKRHDSSRLYPLVAFFKISRYEGEAVV
jgi:hypothetical protein